MRCRLIQIALFAASAAPLLTNMAVSGAPTYTARAAERSISVKLCSSVRGVQPLTCKQELNKRGGLGDGVLGKAASFVDESHRAIESQPLSAPFFDGNYRPLHLPAQRDADAQPTGKLRSLSLPGSINTNAKIGLTQDRWEVLYSSDVGRIKHLVSNIGETVRRTREKLERSFQLGYKKKAADWKEKHAADSAVREALWRTLDGMRPAHAEVHAETVFTKSQLQGVSEYLSSATRPIGSTKRPPRANTKAWHESRFATPDLLKALASTNKKKSANAAQMVRHWERVASRKQVHDPLQSQPTGLSIALAKPQDNPSSSTSKSPIPDHAIVQHFSTAAPRVPEAPEGQIAPEPQSPPMSPTFADLEPLW